MQRQWILTVLAVSAVWVTSTARLGTAQQSCRGDIDGDAVVSEADVDIVSAALFADTDLVPDVNADGAVSAGDVSEVVGLAGPCPATPTVTSTVTATFTATSTDTPSTPLPTPTVTVTLTRTRPPTSTPTGPSPTSTATATRTATATPTITSTPPPTSTPTRVCTSLPVQLGVTNGQLTGSDCPRAFISGVRPTDVYTFVGTPGTQVTLSVTTPGGAGDIQPYVVLNDSGGQFGRFEGSPPLSFVVTTSKPYEIWVTSKPSTAISTGTYSLTLTSMPCPTPRAITLPFAQPFTLDGTECTDPAQPGLGTDISFADQFTFTVPSVPMNIDILMQQKLETDSIDPAFSVIGPDGFEIVTPDDDGDLGDGIAGLDARARFMAIVAGTYTIIANGGGGTGGYTLFVRNSASTPIKLTNIPADRPLACPPNTVGCSGTLYGDTTRTTWAAPLPIPVLSDDTPELGSPADVYTFTTTNPGEMISVTMEADDDAHLYLLGPATAGNPLVVQDDDSGPVSGTLDAQLAATLVVPGTYTLVAANNSMLQPPDPADPGDIGDTVGYTLFIQKCPVRGALNPALGLDVSSTFSNLDCVGFGGVPFRTYSFAGQAGQFVTTSMSSENLDAFVRVFAPDGTVVENDNDLFDPSTSDARANRLLPVDGSYYVEVSSAVDQGSVDLPSGPAFVLQALSCDTTLASPGAVGGSWTEADCTLASGQKFDVYTLGSLGGLPRAVSLRPPDNGCIVGLLAEGPQVPLGGCNTELTEFPAVGNAPYGFIVAGGDAATRGAYTVQLNSCALTSIGYGAAVNGALNAGSCPDAAGFGANWFLVRTPGALTRFNDGFSGEIAATFAQGGTISDLLGGFGLTAFFTEDPTVMFPLGSDLAALLKITGSTPADQGAYQLTIDPAFVRQ